MAALSTAPWGALRVVRCSAEGNKKLLELSPEPRQRWFWPDCPCRAWPCFHLLVPLSVRSAHQTTPSACPGQTCREQLPALEGPRARGRNGPFSEKQCDQESDRPHCRARLGAGGASGRDHPGQIWPRLPCPQVSPASWWAASSSRTPCGASTATLTRAPTIRRSPRMSSARGTRPTSPVGGHLSPALHSPVGEEGVERHEGPPPLQGTPPQHSPVVPPQT